MQIAQQYSEDKARSGGDLGWKKKTDVVSEFAEAAFKLQVIGLVDWLHFKLQVRRRA